MSTVVSCVQLVSNHRREAGARYIHTYALCVQKHNIHQLQVIEFVVDTQRYNLKTIRDHMDQSCVGLQPLLVNDTDRHVTLRTILPCGKYDN